MLQSKSSDGEWRDILYDMGNNSSMCLDADDNGLSDFRIIMNIYYNPVAPLRKVIEDNGNLYVPVIGGASTNEYCTDDWCSENLFRDDDGEDNISSMNHRYNEMTSIYWYWKNRLEKDNPEYVGYNHYRRLFRLEDLKDHGDYDIICQTPILMTYSIPPFTEVHHCDIEYGYGICHSRTDWYAFAMEASRMGFDIYNWKKLGVMPSPCNMFMMKRPLFEQYCGFMFKLLDSVNRHVSIEGRDNYQKRAMAFISERATSLWIWTMAMKNGMKIKELEIDFHPDWKDNGLNERGTY